jgi:hypothetical protein
MWKIFFHMYMDESHKWMKSLDYHNFGLVSQQVMAKLLKKENDYKTFRLVTI